MQRNVGLMMTSDSSSASPSPPRSSPKRQARDHHNIKTTRGKILWDAPRNSPVFWWCFLFTLGLPSRPRLWQPLVANCFCCSAGCSAGFFFTPFDNACRRPTSAFMCHVSLLRDWKLHLTYLDEGGGKRCTNERRGRKWLNVEAIESKENVVYL